MGVTQFVFLAGDSSLDNKHWFFSGFRTKAEQIMAGECDFIGKAINGYERVLSPPFMVKDVAYWMNKELLEYNSGSVVSCCLNCAVEESCIVGRETTGLPPQDLFIRDTITSDDVLVVDVGGNDVALSPTPGVIFNIAWLLKLTPQFCIEHGGPFCAPGLLYFIHMFSTRLKRYIHSLIEKQKPKKVVVCMLYFLDEVAGGSWADFVLGKLGYDTNPSKLQAVMRQVYYWGVKSIKIPGVEIVTLPLYETLDGKHTGDYVQRVEPSVEGGRKLACTIAKALYS